MASEEVSLASATPDDGMKDRNKVPEETSPDYATCDSSKNDNDNTLAEENHKLKEMLQKLLASVSGQIGITMELSEQVRTLKRKLLRKKRPKSYKISRKLLHTSHIISTVSTRQGQVAGKWELNLCNEGDFSASTIFAMLFCYVWLSDRAVI
ncbi:hypothetical protein ABZP36_032455 [Zizania latifolia]